MTTEIGWKIVIGVFLSIICCACWWIAFLIAKKNDEICGEVFICGGTILSVWWVGGFLLLLEMMQKNGLPVVYTDYDGMLLWLAWVPCGISIVPVGYLFIKFIKLYFLSLNSFVENIRIRRKQKKVFKEIKKQTKYIEKDIKRYYELKKFSSCTTKDIFLINTMLNLFTIINGNFEKDFKILLQPYIDCAKQKGEIEGKVKYVAGLYKDIGKVEAANNLFKRMKIDEKSV